MVEGAGFENRKTRKGLTGSNPVVSAKPMTYPTIRGGVLGTLGSSHAAVTLTQRLLAHPNKKMLGKVSCMLSEYQRVLNQIIEVPLPLKTVKLLFNLLRKNALQRASTISDDPKICSYVRNLVVAKYRTTLDQYPW